jgi:hypothetical protein
MRLYGGRASHPDRSSSASKQADDQGSGEGRILAGEEGRMSTYERADHPLD